MDVNFFFFLSILQKNPTSSILNTHFYKTPRSICLFYTLFYLNNIFLTFFIISQLPMAPPTLTLGVAKLNTTREPNTTRHDTKLASYGLRLNGFMSYLG